MSLKEKMDPISIYNVEFFAICYFIIHFEASINTEKNYTQQNVKPT